MAGEIDPRVTLDHSEQHRQTLLGDPDRYPTAGVIGGLADECLDLDEEWTGPLEHRGECATERHAAPSITKRLRGVDPEEARFAHLKDPDLIDRTEAVLLCAEHAEVAVAIAFQEKHRINEMFQRLRPRDRRILIDVADEKHGRSGALGGPQEEPGDLADLGWGAR